jgi:BirA family biotin operon repressor/biotin-[acetyl-CoA-carboxylase] ligase
LSIAAGVAVAETLRAVAKLDARLKWPNDVLVGGRKIAGVLLERHGEAVILGIGINVTRDAVPLDLATQATSIAREGASPDREELLTALLDVVAVWRGRLEREGFDPIQAQWTALAGMLGRPVAVDGVAGTALGIDADGALLVQTEGGSTRILAGDVVELATG